MISFLLLHFFIACRVLIFCEDGFLGTFNLMICTINCSYCTFFFFLHLVCLWIDCRRNNFLRGGNAAF